LKELLYFLSKRAASNSAARQAVTLLQEKGMLKEISGRKWRQLYLARSITGSD